MQTFLCAQPSAGKGGLRMSEEKKKQEQEKETLRENAAKGLSPTWAQECIEDIDDWIESQGIYLRQ